MSDTGLPLMAKQAEAAVRQQSRTALLKWLLGCYMTLVTWRRQYWLAMPCS